MQKLTRISDTAYYSSRFGFDVIQALAWVCFFSGMGCIAVCSLFQIARSLIRIELVSDRDFCIEHFFA